MSPDDAVDVAMRGPFEDGHDGEQLDPPTPEVEAAMRSFLRALDKARPGIEYDVGYDAMEGLTVDFPYTDIDEMVAVIMWNDSKRAVVCGPGRVAAVGAPRAEAASLVPEVLARLDAR